MISFNEVTIAYGMCKCHQNSYGIINKLNNKIGILKDLIARFTSLIPMWNTTKLLLRHSRRVSNLNLIILL